MLFQYGNSVKNVKNKYKTPTRANDFPRSWKTDGIRGIYPVKRNYIPVF